MRTLMIAVVGGGLIGCTQPGTAPSSLAEAAPPPSTSAKPPTLADEAGAVARNKVSVAFLPGGTVLTADAQHSLDVAARLFRDAKPVQMFVAGYADGTGNEYANLLLSAQRARMVKRDLVARGIPPDRLLLQAYGVSDPVDAKDTSASANRRVEITWRLL